MSEHSELWKCFYQSEQDFFKFIIDNARHRKTIDDKKAEYTMNQRHHRLLLTPPDTIRQIYQLDQHLVFKAEKMAQDVISNYTKAMIEDGKNVKRLPARFPQIIDNVTQVNIQTNDAYSSFIVDFEPVPIARFFDDKNVSSNTDKAIGRLRALGIESYVSKATVKCEGQDAPATYIYANAKHLLNYFKVGDLELRCRRHSGTQYRAFVYSGKTKIRTNLGYLICSGNFEIYKSVPQPPRKHKATLSRQNLSFEGGIVGQYVDFYIEKPIT